jgi:hypothetical protein
MKRSIDDGVAVQEVLYDKLRRRLLQDGQVLESNDPIRSGGRTNLEAD